MTEVAHLPIDIPGFRGALLRPGADGYDVARRVFNAMIDRHPALIARCVDTADVVAAVGLARDLGLPLSVYGGGHAVTGSAVVDGGVCVDLRAMNDVTVDPGRRTVRAAAGLTWGELDAATQEHGLAVTGGRVSTTGVAGLTLGSGSGWLERALGYTCDNLVEAEVVTADGRVVVASAAENGDLFWALRGGGGNFGIVTRFTFRLHPVGPIVLGGMLMYPAEAAGDVLRFWRDFMATAPDAVGSGTALITAPPAPFVPEPLRGRPAIGVIVCYAGPLDEGERVLAPLLGFGAPAVAVVQPMPYVAVQRMLDDANPEGMQNYWTADFLADLPDPAIDALAEYATRPVSPLTQVILVAGGGALARVPRDATAFGRRDAPWNIHYLSMWADPADSAANIAWTRAVSGALKPWTTGQVYLNWIGDEGAERVESGFGSDTWARLREVKQAWDPENLFRHNHNIPPQPAT